MAEWMKEAMIFAAGLGTRLRPLTDNLPKALVPVGGKPMLEHVILRLKAAGFAHIVINVHHFGQKIIDFLEEHKNFGVAVDISDERDALLDTGGGIRKAAGYFRKGSPVLIHNVDIWSDADLAGLYEGHGRSRAATSLWVSKRSTSRYLLFDEEHRLCGWENTKTGEVKSPFPGFSPSAYEPYAFGGIHVISPALLERMQDWGEKFSIIDFYLSVAGEAIIQACPASAGALWMDLGKPEALTAAENYLKSAGHE